MRLLFVLLVGLLAPTAATAQVQLAQGQQVRFLIGERTVHGQVIEQRDSTLLIDVSGGDAAFFNTHFPSDVWIKEADYPRWKGALVGAGVGVATIGLGLAGATVHCMVTEGCGEHFALAYVIVPAVFGPPVVGGAAALGFLAAGPRWRSVELEQTRLRLGSVAGRPGLRLSVRPLRGC